MRRLLTALSLALLALFASVEAWAGAQREEALSSSVRAALSKAIADQAPVGTSFRDSAEEATWLADMSGRLAKRIPDEAYRIDLLLTVHYEARRAGLDPQWVLGLIQVESAFRKYAVSRAGARGYMQVMPFWIKSIGTPDHNLFSLRTNLRYGCTILRHYLDLENGNMFRALGRYNGSVGRPEYPNAVRSAWRSQWTYRQAVALN